MLTSKPTGNKQGIPIKQPTATQLAGGLIISISEARKLLGADGNMLSDDEVASMILDLMDISHEIIKQAICQNSHYNR